jgi:hypothetical protein
MTASPMPRSRWVLSLILAALAVVGGTAATAAAQARAIAPRRGVVGANGQVNLPYMQQDATGNMWRIYQGGWLQQQGNMPLYSQGAMLMINGNQANQNNNMARLDDKTGELVFENMMGPGCTITRRILIDKDGGYVRYADIIKNTAAQEVTLQLQIQTNLNYGINVSTLVPDPKKREQNLAWVAQTGAGPSVVEMFGGKGAKIVPSINAPQGNSFCQAMMPLTLGAGKEAAIVHIHATAPTQDAGVKFVNELKELDLIKSLPKEIRKLVVNFRIGQSIIGDLEILRGDLLDVVELKSGDQFKGTLKEQSFALKTFYGDVTLPVDRVVALVNVGRFRPRQLLVTADGQVFGGSLSKQTIDLQLSSGQVTQIPLSQMSRVGYRKRQGEPEEWTFDKPMVLLRSGERVGVTLPPGPIEVQTRYGKLSLPTNVVASISLQAEEHGVHEITLTDGSKFAGLVSADAFTMTLEGSAPAAEGAGNAGAQVVKFPASTVARLQFVGKDIDTDDDAATVELTNDDTLVGALTGQLKIDTAFDTITVNSGEIKTLTHAAPGSLDVTVTLWDGTTLSGQLQEQSVPATLAAGVQMTLPVALLVKYEQPQPQPAAGMVEEIKATIGRLNADDWKERDRAEAQLVAMGPVAIGTLKKLRTGQPPEAQQRIDSVIKALEKQKGTQKTSAAANPRGGAGAPAADLPQVQLQAIER